MKHTNHVLVLLMLTFLFSCGQECSFEVTGVSFYGIDSERNDWEAETQFFEDLVEFEAAFVLDRDYPQFNPCKGEDEYKGLEYSKLNDVNENEFAIYTQSLVVINEDSLDPGANLIEYFEFERIEDTQLRYRFKEATSLNLKNGLHKFYFDSKTTDNVILLDSCVSEFKN